MRLHLISTSISNTFNHLQSIIVQIMTPWTRAIAYHNYPNQKLLVHMSYFNVHFMSTAHPIGSYKIGTRKLQRDPLLSHSAQLDTSPHRSRRVSGRDLSRCDLHRAVNGVYLDVGIKKHILINFNMIHKNPTDFVWYIWGQSQRFKAVAKCWAQNHSYTPNMWKHWCIEYTAPGRFHIHHLRASSIHAF